MKIPVVLMASLLAVGVSGQTSKPGSKNVKKPVKKVRKVQAAQSPKQDPVKPAKFKDSITRHNSHYCPACGMG